jgi:hypothetical protein
MIQTYESLANFGFNGPIADGTPLANSAALTSITPAPDFVLPANFLVPGNVIKLTAAGRFSTSGTPTLLIGAYYGGVAGVALATTGALTTLSGAANSSWEVEIVLAVRSQGSSGTVMAIGKAFGITSITAAALLPASAPSVATVDTTAAKSLVIGAQWGTGASANTITCHQFLIESIA